ncbi:DMT family transporter [Pseudogemmobacter sonorensis]|uniref:DMT family transporter n=1 Tax=Pseudogemmobacter sonorensis TaxID=2989681 RepID=UPI00368893B8
MRGIVLMNLAMAFFTLNDTAMKAVMEVLPMMQAIGLRGLLATLALAGIAWRMGVLLPPLAPRDRRLILWRTLAELVATLSFLAALIHMPIAEISAILQVLPLAMTLAAALFLGERVGWRRVLAIATGFLGVLLVIRPGGEAFNIWALSGLLSVAAVVLRDLATRRLAQAVPSVFIAMVTAGAVMLMGFAGSLLGEWVTPGPREVGLILLAAAALILGLVTVVAAMRVGDVAVVSPFRYASLLWAIVLGWLVFGHLPDALALTGAVLIVASGVFTLLREQKLKRARPT